MSTQSRSHFDAIVVGAGPAGIFAALELARRDGLHVLLLEKGPDIVKRTCPARSTGVCIDCDPCGVTCGWGGAGAFSDGKLTLSTAVGGWLTEFTSEGELAGLVDHVDAIWREYGAPDEVHGQNARQVERIRREALMRGIKLIAAPVRHMGTERSYEILKRMRADLENDVTIVTRAEATRILVEDGPGGRRAAGVALADGREFRADAVVVAPGRQGAGWLVSECRRLGLTVRANAVDIGVRVEVPAVVMEPLTKVLYESKLVYYTPTFDDQVRTFCMNPGGHVSLENYGDVVTVNGHSYADHAGENTNVALLVSTRFTEPFDEPISYGKSIARLANLIGDDIIVQRLGDLQQGKRSTQERIERGTVRPTLKGATPGDLSFVLPYRYLKDILEMLEAMDTLAPGVKGRDTLLYGVEVKFYSSRPALDEHLQTQVKDLYAIGDGAGVTRGLVQASASGVLTARAILGDRAARDGAGPAAARAGRAPASTQRAKTTPAASRPAGSRTPTVASGPRSRSPKEG